MLELTIVVLHNKIITLLRSKNIYLMHSKELCLSKIQIARSYYISRNYSKSGRTDKGVSALGNVISIRVREIQENETENYIRMMNRNLPSDIRILAMCKTKD